MSVASAQSPQTSNENVSQCYSDRKQCFCVCRFSRARQATIAHWKVTGAPSGCCILHLKIIADMILIYDCGLLKTGLQLQITQNGLDSGAASWNSSDDGGIGDD